MNLDSREKPFVVRLRKCRSPICPHKNVPHFHLRNATVLIDPEGELAEPLPSWYNSAAPWLAGSARNENKICNNPMNGSAHSPPNTNKVSQRFTENDERTVDLTDLCQHVKESESPETASLRLNSLIKKQRQMHSVQREMKELVQKLEVQIRNTSGNEHLWLRFAQMKEELETLKKPQNENKKVTETRLDVFCKRLADQGFQCGQQDEPADGSRPRSKTVRTESSSDGMYAGYDRYDTNSLNSVRKPVICRSRFAGLGC